MATAANAGIHRFISRRFLSTLWPVVHRELRAGARHCSNYWLRAGAVTGACVAAALNLAALRSALLSPAGMGQILFYVLHIVLVCLILFSVPAMTADCIAREKREGTLGLLFLTPLSATGIVLGKMLVQVLRAFTLWLAVLPILTLPFLMGGISWIDVIGAVSIEFCAMLVGLTAGLLASSMVQNRTYGFFIAEFLMISVLAVLILAMHASWPSQSLNGSARIFLRAGFYLLASGGGAGFNLANAGAGAALLVMVKAVGLLLLLFLLSIRVAASAIRRSWQDRVPSARQQGLIHRFCTPLRERAFKRSLNRTMTNNPIAWLQVYSWKARVSKWGLCLLIVLAVSFLLRGGDIPGPETYFGLFLGMAAFFTYVGVSSFLEEKKSGALELLLITPLKVRQIILGRVLGLWKQFLPSFAAIALFHLGTLWAYSHVPYIGQFSFDSTCNFYVWAICTFLSLPFFSTYAALRVKNLFVAGVLTWVGVAFSTAYAGVAYACFGARSLEAFAFYTVLAFSSFVLLMFFLLRHSLSRRIYSF